MLDRKTVEDFLLGLPDTSVGHPFGDEADVFSAGGAMFALITAKKEPVNLSLRCDPELSKVLRERYETVMPGYHLNKKHWNTIVLTGQLSWQEVQDLIRHAYDLARKEAAATDQPA